MGASLWRRSRFGCCTLLPREHSARTFSGWSINRGAMRGFLQFCQVLKLTVVNKDEVRCKYFQAFLYVSIVDSKGRIEMSN